MLIWFIDGFEKFESLFFRSLLKFQQILWTCSSEPGLKFLKLIPV